MNAGDQGTAYGEQRTLVSGPRKAREMTMIGRRTVTSVGLALLLLAGCGGDGDGDGGESSASASPTTQPAATSPGASEGAAGQEPAEGSASPTDEQTSSAAPEDGYVVQQGDTLTAIAERFGTTVEAIVEENDLEDPDVIVVGQELAIPQS